MGCQSETIDADTAGTTLTCQAASAGGSASQSVTCTATDQAGNTAEAEVSYSVLYGFEGFFAPVDNPPALNRAKAGQSTPLKWRLVDANGAPVSDLAGVSVTVTGLACSAG